MSVSQPGTGSRPCPPSWVLLEEQSVDGGRPHDFWSIDTCWKPAPRNGPGNRGTCRRRRQQGVCLRLAVAALPRLGQSQRAAHHAGDGDRLLAGNSRRRRARPVADLPISQTDPGATVDRFHTFVVSLAYGPGPTLPDPDPIALQFQSGFGELERGIICHADCGRQRPRGTISLRPGLSQSGGQSARGHRLLYEAE